MRIDHQTSLFALIKQKIGNQDSLGNVVGDILSISPDAVYRRYRGETLLTIFELEKLSKHFGISLDSLFEMNKNKVMFDFKALNEYDFSMDDYLQDMLDGLRILKSQKNPELIILINNLPFLQLLNFPHLVRFKLFFWAKTHVQVKEYQNAKFKYEAFSEKTFEIGKEILQIYNTIPSREIVDPELLRGFAREIYYYFNAQHFEDSSYAIHLLDVLEQFVDHFHQQAEFGKKFIANTAPPASGNNLELYLNETMNGNATIHYQTDEVSGVYLAYNILNLVHSSDNAFTEDNLKVLNKQMANSSLISVTNEGQRNNYFHQTKSMINNFRLKIKAELLID